MTDALLATADGLVLKGLALPAQGAVRGAVAMVHGLGEHCRRYEALHRALNQAGFAVGTADLRGFGLSPGPRGHIDAWNDYRLDTAAILELARSLAPDKPVFLFGHSMGGLIALDYALHHPQGLAGVIASGPALQPAGPRRVALEFAARVLSRIVPRHSVVLNIDKSGISSQPEEVARYEADPLRQDRVSMRWGTEILRVMKATREQAAQFSLPLLLLHGGADPVNAPAGSEAFARDCGHPDVTLKLYPGNFHEVHHDISRRDFERDLLRWLRTRAQRREPPTAGGLPGAPASDDED
jgi:alpha-beta hydrolase superfamily lysophospholipase